jgi:CMP-N,N'-diacetyllegionaminic acid synthase
MKNNVVAIIPARGGSKGVPKKNIKCLLGKPLIAYSIEHALKTKNIDRVIVSTDCDEIATVSEKYGAEIIKRPENISGDFASSEDALIHSVNLLKASNYDVSHVVFLQCTSPIRSETDVSDCLNLVLSQKFDSALSVVKNHKFLWRTDFEGVATPINYEPHKRKMRQEISEFQENGSIYVMKAEDLLNTECRLNGKIGIHVMEEETGYEIDTQFDFKIIESLMEK